MTMRGIACSLYTRYIILTVIGPRNIGHNVADVQTAGLQGHLVRRSHASQVRTHNMLLNTVRARKHCNMYDDILFG